jgi:hypothetical protein
MALKLVSAIGRALASFSGTGLLAWTGTAFVGRTITGTADRISVSNGSGVSGNPTLDIAATYVGQTSITTLGTIATGTWSATTIAVDKGGTGQTSYTNGQLLIGNTTGNTLAKGSLTAPAAGLTITGGAGSITFALANDLSGIEGQSGTGHVVRTGDGTYAQRTITGTASRLTVTNGDGVSGNPTLDISTSYVGQATITTLGTITAGTWNGTDIAVADGGTGSSTAAGAASNLGLGTEDSPTFTRATLSSGLILGTANSYTLDLAGEITLSGGGYIAIDTNAGDPTDNCNSILGGTVGEIIIVHTVASGRDVTMVDGASLLLAGNFTLATANDSLGLICAASGVWRELFRSSN